MADDDKKTFETPLDKLVDRAKGAYDFSRETRNEIINEGLERGEKALDKAKEYGGKAAEAVENEIQERVNRARARALDASKAARQHMGQSPEKNEAPEGQSPTPPEQEPPARRGVLNNEHIEKEGVEIVNRPNNNGLPGNPNQNIAPKVPLDQLDPPVELAPPGRGMPPAEQDVAPPVGAGQPPAPAGMPPAWGNEPPVTPEEALEPKFKPRYPEHDKVTIAGPVYGIGQQLTNVRADKPAGDVKTNAIFFTNEKRETYLGEGSRLNTLGANDGIVITSGSHINEANREYLKKLDDHPNYEVYQNLHQTNPMSAHALLDGFIGDETLAGIGMTWLEQSERLELRNKVEHALNNAGGEFTLKPTETETPDKQKDWKFEGDDTRAVLFFAKEDGIKKPIGIVMTRTAIVNGEEAGRITGVIDLTERNPTLRPIHPDSPEAARSALVFPATGKESSLKVGTGDIPDGTFPLHNGMIVGARDIQRIANVFSDKLNGYTDIRHKPVEVVTEVSMEEAYKNQMRTSLEQFKNGATVDPAAGRPDAGQSQPTPQGQVNNNQNLRR